MNRIPRPRATYANVVATLALVLALGGTSYAAATLPRNSVDTPQLKNDAVTSAKIRAGGVGTTDLSAAARRLAASGPVSPSVVSGALHDVAASGPFGTNWRRAPLFETVAYNETNLATAITIAPNRPLVARSLAVRIDNDVPAGAVVKVDLIATPSLGNETAAISCTITGTDAPNQTACVSSGSGPVPAGSYLYILSTVSGGTSAENNPGSIRWGLTLEEKR
jgi:hypothetical protein